MRLRSSGGKLLAKCGPILRAASAGKIAIAGLGTYRGALETVPERRLAQRRQRPRRQPVREGRGPERGPALLADGELEAQAIASRSFALTAGVGGNGYDLYADTRSQDYKGLESEYQSSDEAAEATRGQVVEYDGKVAAEACSRPARAARPRASRTSSAVRSPTWSSVPDPYDYYCPLHTWTLKFGGPEISSKLSDYLNGRLKKVVITKRRLLAANHRSEALRERRRHHGDGEQLEVALGGYSTWMSFQKVMPGKSDQPVGA